MAQEIFAILSVTIIRRPSNDVLCANSKLPGLLTQNQGVAQGLVMAFDANLSDSTGGSSISIPIGHRQHSRKKTTPPGSRLSWPVPGGASVLTNIIVADYSVMLVLTRA